LDIHFENRGRPWEKRKKNPMREVGEKKGVQRQLPPNTENGPEKRQGETKEKELGGKRKINALTARGQIWGKVRWIKKRRGEKNRHLKWGGQGTGT